MKNNSFHQQNISQCAVCAALIWHFICANSARALQHSELLQHAGLVEEYKHGDYPRHCSPCFLVAKPGSTAMRLVVDYGEVNKKTQNHSWSISNMETSPRSIAKCRFKTKMDKRRGFWQVDLARAAQELLAFIAPKGRVFPLKVMPFGVANGRALKPDRVVRSRGRSGMGSNIAWHRRHNDSVD